MINRMLSRVLCYAAHCCQTDDRGRAGLKTIEKRFPEVDVFSYLQWPERKEFFYFDGKELELRDYYREMPIWQLESEIRDKCSNNNI